MKKGLIIVIAIVAVIAILGGSLVSSYNGLVEKQADVEMQMLRFKFSFSVEQI